MADVLGGIKTFEDDPVANFCPNFAVGHLSAVEKKNEKAVVDLKPVGGAKE